MNLSNQLWRQIEQIRHADMAPSDRELLRPAFAALDEGTMIAVPYYVILRIRDIHARMPK